MHGIKNLTKSWNHVEKLRMTWDETYPLKFIVEVTQPVLKLKFSSTSWGCLWSLVVVFSVLRKCSILTFSLVTATHHRAVMKFWVISQYILCLVTLFTGHVWLPCLTISEQLHFLWNLWRFYCSCIIIVCA